MKFLSEADLFMKPLPGPGWWAPWWLAYLLVWEGPDTRLTKQATLVRPGAQYIVSIHFHPCGHEI